ncbi:uncharacterized protein [Antedon mediterranea]|uniref:uncharacterized protein n=1 Tax=Antedon mediterranea TaxID=105859 RepID=UPI003AF59009
MADVYQFSLALLLLCVLPSVQSQGNYKLLGCFWDDQIRALPDLTSCAPPCFTVCSAGTPYCQTGSMTVDFCTDLCRSKQHQYAGLQAGNQCFCGTSGASFSQYGEHTCSISCVGNSSQICGDVYRNSVYDTLYQAPTCPQPGTVVNGRILTVEKLEYFEGDSISYICDDTAFLLGEPNRTCLSSGQWNVPPPECRAVCNEPIVGMDSNRGAPAPIEKYVSSVNIAGERYALSCLVGYTSLSDVLLATCQADGTWGYNSSDTICEVVVCPTPTPQEGVQISVNSYSYLSILTYTCLEGFTSSSGSVSRQCQADGSWSGMALSCTVVSCPPPQITADMTITPGPYYFGDTVMYFCRDNGLLMGEQIRTCTAGSSWSGQPPYCVRPTTRVMNYATTAPQFTAIAATGRPTDSRNTPRYVTTPRPTTMPPYPTMKLPTTRKHVTTEQETRPQTFHPRKTSIAETITNLWNTGDSSITNLVTNIKSASDQDVTSQDNIPTTSEGFNEKAKSDKSPADFMILIVIGAGVFSVILLSIIFTVACVNSPKRGKVQVSKQINFISSKETGSMMGILWPEDITHDSPRSRADSGLPPSARNSPNSTDDSPDANGNGGMVNLAFEHDETDRRNEADQRDEDPYHHRIDFAVVNEKNNISSVLINSGIMSPAPQTQDDRTSISHSRMNSFQNSEDVDSLYAKVDMSKKTKMRMQNVHKDDALSVDNPIYEKSPPKFLLPVNDNQTINGGGVVRKTSRRTPSDVSVSSRTYWAQYEEQVTRL